MEDVLIRLHHKEVALEIVRSGKHGPNTTNLFVCLPYEPPGSVLV